MITVTRKQVLESCQAIIALSSQLMPAAGASAVLAAHRAIEPVRTATFNILDDLKKADITDEERNGKFGEFLAETVSLNVRPIPFLLLGNAQISPAHLAALEWLIAMPVANAA